MKRRELLALLGAAGALGAGALIGLYGGSAAIATRARRAPAHLMARLHRRTRALDPAELTVGRDLAG